MSFTISIKDRTLTISLPSSANVKVRYNVDEIYSGIGASHVISLPIKDSMPAEGSYVANIDGVETLLAYSYPKEEPSLIWGENGLLSLIDISDSTVYSGTITAQSLVCTPPLPLAVKSGTNSVHYPPNIYSGLWSVNRKVTVAYNQGNGLVVVKDIDATFTHYVLNINAKNLHEAVTNYINEYVNSCSPCRETATFTKVNAYMEQYHGYISLCKYEEAYNALVAAGNLVGVSKDVEEIIPFYLSDCGCECDEDIVPAHTAYYGFFVNETITEAQAKTLNVDKYNIHVYRDWHMNQDGLTDRYAYIILPTMVAQMVQLVSINDGLPAEWTNRQTLDIDGQQYTAIRSPYKFFDISMSFKTSKVASTDVALEWINNNGTNLLNHVGNQTIHLTSEEKTQGALPTGVANPSPISGKDLSTVKKLAQEFDKSFRLIGVYAPIGGTSAITITQDQFGNLLSSLNLKNCFIDIYAKTTAISIQQGVLRINGVTTNTYKIIGNVSSGIFFRNNAETYMNYTLNFNGILKFLANGVHSSTQTNDATSSPLSYNGINRTIINQKLERIDLILGGSGVTFQDDSIITIYAL